MKYLDGEYYVEVKGHRYKIHPTEILFHENEIHHNLLERNIKFKMRFKFVKIRKLLQMIMMN